jgi:DNA-binding winged helix-turn-helix (wHTH) protein
MSASLQSTTDFRVGDWVVRPNLAEIVRGTETAHLTPRAMAVLVYLAEAKGAVVARNELLDAIWPRMSVTQDALSQCLVELRKAFGDNSKNPTVIGTIPKVGVRLMAQVAPLEAPRPAVTAEARVPEMRVANRWVRTAAVAAFVVVGVAAAVFVARSNRTQPAAALDPAAITTNARARDLYLSANDYTRRPNRVEALTHEEELLRRAVAEDPDFALGWARLGGAHTGMSTALRLAWPSRSRHCAARWLSPPICPKHTFPWRTTTTKDSATTRRR